MNYYAIGYHGTCKVGANKILSNGIDFGRRSDDVFLGCGFYVWRDSVERAKAWNSSESVIEIILECNHDEMLNFTSMNWNNERYIMKLYFDDFLPKKIYFGEFIDFLIANGVDIKLVSILDLKNRKTLLPIQDPIFSTDKTIFSYGDIQICIKSQNVVKSIFERNVV